MKLYGYKRDQFWDVLQKYLEEYNNLWYLHNHRNQDVVKNLSKV